MNDDDVYGYDPEKPDDACTHQCYCHAAAVGGTRFWGGRVHRYVWHCADHLPKAAATLQAVAP